MRNSVERCSTTQLDKWEGGESRISFFEKWKIHLHKESVTQIGFLVDGQTGRKRPVWNPFLWTWLTWTKINVQGPQNRSVSNGLGRNGFNGPYLYVFQPKTNFVYQQVFTKYILHHQPCKLILNSWPVDLLVCFKLVWTCEPINLELYIADIDNLLHKNETTKNKDITYT